MLIAFQELRCSKITEFAQIPQNMLSVFRCPSSPNFISITLGDLKLRIHRGGAETQRWITGLKFEDSQGILTSSPLRLRGSTRG
jgi:hypothetical protein